MDIYNTIRLKRAIGNMINLSADYALADQQFVRVTGTHFITTHVGEARSKRNSNFSFKIDASYKIYVKLNRRIQPQSSICHTPNGSYIILLSSYHNYQMTNRRSAVYYSYSNQGYIYISYLKYVIIGTLK